MRPTSNAPVETTSALGWARRVLRRQLDALSRLAAAAWRLKSAPLAVEPVTAATFFTGVRNFEKAMRLRGRVDWALRLIEALRARLSADLQAVDSGGAPSVPVEASSVADDPDPASANEAAALTDRPERGERRERPDRDHFGFGPRGSDKALAEILKRPTDEIIALICRELGLPEDWPRLAEDAWARETADDDGAEPPAPSPSPRMPRIFAAPS